MQQSVWWKQYIQSLLLHKKRIKQTNEQLCLQSLEGEKIAVMRSKKIMFQTYYIISNVYYFKHIILLHNKQTNYVQKNLSQATPA